MQQVTVALDSGKEKLCLFLIIRQVLCRERILQIRFNGLFCQHHVFIVAFHELPQGLKIIFVLLIVAGGKLIFKI